MNNKKVASNAKWIILCKVIQSLLQLVIGMLSARYLGPANYGIINYAKSVVAFVLPVAQLGLNATLVREFIEYPDREDEVLGSSLLVSFCSSVMCIVMVAFTVSALNFGEGDTILVCILYSLSLVFQAIELIQYWFHSKLQSKYPSMMMVVAYVVVSAYKIFLLVSQKSIYWFAVVYSVEYGVVGFSLLAIYLRQGGRRLRFSVKMAKQLIAGSYPYIFSSMMVTIFQNTDHVMLKMLSGNEENGFYSAAITCASVCSFVYAAIIDSMRPVILTAKKNGSDDYGRNISTLYCIITYLALAQGVFFALFAKPIVLILYGAEYGRTIPVLQMLVWYVTFAQMGRIRNIWILAETRQKMLWKINLTGAVANVLLNAVLIPRWGAVGAAFASLVTQFFTNFILGFLFRPIRENNRLMLTGIDPRFLVRMVRSADFIKIRRKPHD